MQALLLYSRFAPHLDQVFMTAWLKPRVMAYSHDILLLMWQESKQCQALILLYDFLSQGRGEETAHFLSGLHSPHELRAAAPPVPQTVSRLLLLFRLFFHQG